MPNFPPLLLLHLFFCSFVGHQSLGIKEKPGEKADKNGILEACTIWKVGQTQKKLRVDQQLLYKLMPIIISSYYK